MSFEYQEGDEFDLSPAEASVKILEILSAGGTFSLKGNIVKITSLPKKEGEKKTEAKKEAPEKVEKVEEPKAEEPVAAEEEKKPARGRPAKAETSDEDKE